MANHIVTLPTRKTKFRIATEAETAQQPAPHLDPPRLIGNTGEQAAFVLPLRIPSDSGKGDGSKPDAGKGDGGKSDKAAPKTDAAPAAKSDKATRGAGGSRSTSGTTAAKTG